MLGFNFIVVVAVLHHMIISFNAIAESFNTFHSHSFLAKKRNVCWSCSRLTFGRLLMGQDLTPETTTTLKIIQPTWLFNNKSFVDPSFVKEIYTNANVSKDWSSLKLLAKDILIMGNNKYLDLPLVSLNPYDVSNKLYKCMTFPQDSRIKSLFYLIKSMGGGKTRLLCEVWKELLSKSDVLPIAITFSRNTPWLQSSNCTLNSPIRDRMLYNQMTNCGRLATMMSVAGRMIHSLVGGDFVEIFDSFVKQCLGFVPKNGCNDDNEWMKFRNMDIYDRKKEFYNKISTDFFRDFCGDLIAIVNYHRPQDRQIKGIVLLIDDSEKAIKNMKDNDPYYFVRHGILDECFDDAKTLTGCLAMTGLEFSGIDQSNERPIQLLKNPDVLDLDELMNNWFSFLNWNKDQLYSLRRYLALVNGHPKTLERLREYLISDEKATALSNSKNFTTELCNLVTKKFEEARFFSIIDS